MGWRHIMDGTRKCLGSSITCRPCVLRAIEIESRYLKWRSIWNCLSTEILIIIQREREIGFRGHNFGRKRHSFTSFWVLGLIFWEPSLNFRVHCSINWIFSVLYFFHCPIAENVQHGNSAADYFRPCRLIYHIKNKYWVLKNH